VKKNTATFELAKSDLFFCDCVCRFYKSTDYSSPFANWATIVRVGSEAKFLHKMQIQGLSSICIIFSEHHVKMGKVLSVYDFI
jgi:hypothetical protein